MRKARAAQKAVLRTGVLFTPSCPGLSRLWGRSPFGAAKARASTPFFQPTDKTWMAGHRRAEATPFFERLCPAMTRKDSISQLEQAPLPVVARGRRHLARRGAFGGLRRGLGHAPLVGDRQDQL